MKPDTIRKLLAVSVAVTVMPGLSWSSPLERLPTDVLDVVPPSARVSGEPGRITVETSNCRSLSHGDLRRRIVDVAIQEWGYFGFSIVDEASADFDRRRRRAPGEPRPRWVEPEESQRVVHSIAGFWSATGDGSWIIERQNDIWRRAGAEVDRWRDPWSAAFISWVMCEGGLGEPDQFRRHIAHYAYIDQAIEARDGKADRAAFTAYEVGETRVEPGDLLCRARRGAYKSLAERRRDLGVGARSHCDVVVKLDPDYERILVIGGNVRGSVRLKFLPASIQEKAAKPGIYRSIGRGDRVVFAHLKLAAPSIGHDALESSPTLKALGRDPDALAALRKRLSEAEPPAADVAVRPEPTT